ncbi:DNA repair protein RecO [Collibacillus ludicampi]|uniref:DNA repair protein RecO n=1 Tax=Collibacillus ludicampi TaxID=2771369 RepID=A0AAV4LAM4_9BACL|nr:DNA repair protein RecO [Collibacillus ludicampi]GIM44749.1 DNA repair protein RecO [Collibacillus ludicampi]
MYKTEAIVLRGIDYGETNKIVTLLTRDFGKLSVMAGGAKKPQSRLTAASQPFTHGHWILYGGGKGMLRASQAEVIESFRSIREDLYKTAYTAYVMELTERFVEEREPSQGLFFLVLNMLHQIAAGKDAEILIRIFEIKMLRVAGIEPDLLHCTHCRKEISLAVRFSIRLAGPLCESCHDADPQAIWMKPAVFKLMRLFQMIDISRIGTISVQDEVKRQLASVIRQYYDEYTGVTLKSRHFLEQMDRYKL